MRDALAIRATVSIVRNRGGNSTNIERAAKYRERRSARIAVERKHLLIKRHQLRRRQIDRTCDGINATQGELLQYVVLKCRSWNGGRRDDGQRNPNPFAIEKKEQFIVENRTSNATPEMVHRRAGFVISRSGIREIVGGVELRAVPQLVQVSVKLVRSRFGNVVDLRRSVAPLIDGIGKRIDRHFR